MSNVKSVADGATEQVLSLAAPIATLSRAPLAEALRLRLAQGRYRVQSVAARLERYGARYFLVELSDLTGSAVFLAWENRLPRVCDLEPGAIVEAATYIHNVDSRSFLKISRVMPIVAPSLDDRLRTFPKTFTPIPGVVERMCNVVANSITRPELHAFLSAVFADEERIRRFLSAKASNDDHHKLPGGLAQHSVEVAEIVAAIPLLLPHEREIAVVGGLLHDIGKIYTHSGAPDAERWHRLVEHESLALEILAPALATLDNVWADAGLGLRHILTAESPGVRFGIPDRSPMAAAVRCADRVSQEVDLQGQRLGTGPGLAKLPRYRWIWLSADAPNQAEAA